MDGDVGVIEVWIAGGADESFGNCGNRSTARYALWASSAPNCAAANETLESFGFQFTNTTFDAPEHDASKPPRLSAPKEKEPFRKTLAAARDEALGSVAEALMRNPNSAQADRFHGVPSLAAMARAETSRRDTTRRAKLSSVSREKTELADDFADPPPPAFGALGRYMRAVEREEAPDWNAATRRPMRRLLT